MIAPAPRTFFAERDEGDRLLAQDREAAGDRLPQADADDLHFVWSIMPGRVGLASNMGATIARLEQLSHTDMLVELDGVELAEDGTPKTPTKQRGRASRAPADALGAIMANAAERLGAVEDAPPDDELSRRAKQEHQAWMAQHPEHVQLDMPPPELPVAKLRTRRSRLPQRGPSGAKYAHGYPHQHIHVASQSSGSGCCRMVPVTTKDTSGQSVVDLVTAPLTLECWVETNKEAVAARRRARLSWDALRHMIACGQVHYVIALFAMYSESLPVSGFKPVFGDLANLVLDTKTVLLHQQRMTNQLRAALATAAAAPARRVVSKTMRWERAWLAGHEVINTTTFDPQDPMAPVPFGSSEMLAALGCRSVELSPPPPITLPVNFREEVTARAACHDLVDVRHSESPERRAQRTSDTNRIRKEAEGLIKAAGLAYTAAKSVAKVRRYAEHLTYHKRSSDRSPSETET